MEQATQPNSSNPSLQPNGLTEEQRDFICRKLAVFYRARDIITLFRSEYPDTGLTEEQIYNKIRYMATTTKTDKWRKRIEEYRAAVEKSPLSRFPVANRFERLRLLQRLIDDALDPRVRRVLWYPTSRDPSGSMHYEKEEIIEPNYHAAFRGLYLAEREIHKASPQDALENDALENDRDSIPETEPSQETSVEARQ